MWGFVSFVGTAYEDGATATKHGGERSLSDGRQNRNSSAGHLASTDRGSIRCLADGKTRRRMENYGGDGREATAAYASENEWGLWVLDGGRFERQ